MSLAGLRVSIQARRRPLALLALTALTAAAAASMLAAFLVKPDAGLLYIQPEAVVRDGHVVFFPREPFSPAAAAGLLPGVDVILSVNGVPVGSTRDIARAAAEIDSYRPLTIEYSREGGEAQKVVFSPVSRLLHLDWLFMAIPALCMTLAAFALSLKASGRPYTPLLVLADLGCLLSLCASPLSHLGVAWNAACNSGALAAGLFVVSALYFPAPRGRRGLRLIASAGILLAGAALAVARSWIFAGWLSRGGGELSGYRLLGRLGIGAGVAGCVLWAGLMAAAYARSPSRTTKRRIVWMAAGILVALPPWVFFQLLPRALEGASAHASLGAFSTLFLAPVPILVVTGVAGRALGSPRFPLTRLAVSTLFLLLAFAAFCAAYGPVRSAVFVGYGIAPPLSDFFTTALGFLILAPLALAASALLNRVLPLAGTRGPSRVAVLERANAELAAALREARENGRRLLTEDKLSDLRTLMRGFAARIKEPAARVSAGLAAVEEWASAAETRPVSGADAGAPALDGALAAIIQITDAARSLDALCGARVSLPAVTVIEVLVRTAIERVKRSFPHARFDARLHAAERISCHPEELVDALAGVLENAVEAQEGSNEPIRVSSFGEEARIITDIEDNGMGMTDADMKRLFRPFFTTKPGHQGLGLFFARLVVERNGGEISLQAREAGGARCRISFPAADKGE